MSTIKEELQECVCGDWYPADECYELYNGGFVHQDKDDYVMLSSECDSLYMHADEVIYCDCNGEYYLKMSILILRLSLTTMMRCIDSLTICFGVIMKEAQKVGFLKELTIHTLVIMMYIL